MSSRTEVIRVSKLAHTKMTKLKKTATFPEFIDSALDTIEMLAEHEPMYLVGDKIYRDLPSARGQAIQQAAFNNSTSWELPYIVVILGQDSGEA